MSHVPETDSIAAVQFCLKAGEDINAANANGGTALPGAAMRGANQIVHFLGDHGARLDVPDKEGRAPLKVAGGDEKGGLAGYPKSAELLRALAKAGSRSD